MKLDTILVPLDGSTLGEAALPSAVDIARTTGGRLLLRRAAEVHRIVLTADPADAEVAADREAEAYLESVKRRLQAEGVPDVDALVSYGPATRSWKPRRRDARASS